MTKITLQGVIEVPASQFDAVLAALPLHIQNTLSEPGCLTFSVVPSEQQKYQFDVYEEFEDQTSFEAHQVRVSGSSWGQLTQNAKRRYRINKGDKVFEFEK